MVFRVGDVVRHKRYHYRAVVYDWDPFCDVDESWIQHMGVGGCTAGLSAISCRRMGAIMHMR